MKRGERKLYRALGEAATAVAESTDYASEYIAKLRLVDADQALRRWAQEEMARAEPEPSTRVLDPPLYPRREFVYAGECGKKPLDDLIVWVHGGTFHRYGVRALDRGPTLEEALERIREYPADLRFENAFASHNSLDWSLRFGQAGDPEGHGFTRPHMTPEDAAYAALALIEEHEREVYERDLVEGVA